MPQDRPFGVRPKDLIERHGPANKVIVGDISVFKAENGGYALLYFDNGVQKLQTIRSIDILLTRIREILEVKGG